jgi:dodecin
MLTGPSSCSFTFDPRVSSAPTVRRLDHGGTHGHPEPDLVKRAMMEFHHRSEEELVSNRTYRFTEVVGTSPDGVDDAIRNAVKRASTTLRHLDWFEVTQVRGQVVDDKVEHFQVGLKLGFRLEDDE